MSKMSFTPDGEELLHGLKKITLQNWQTPDIPRTFNITGERWVQRLLEPELNPNVPEEVEQLFEIARGSMIYGWYYYALATLAAEQLYRVCELAATLCCKQAGISLLVVPKPAKNNKQHKPQKPRQKRFVEIINDLVKAGIIPKADAVRWHATRQLRNIHSHPKSRTIDTPGNNATKVRLACDRINQLFNEQSTPYS
jgi:hypothetical protein